MLSTGHQINVRIKRIYAIITVSGKNTLIFLSLHIKILKSFLSTRKAEVMINEVLFMEARIFSDYCNLKHLSATKANAIFNKCGIWDYIEACYDTLHMNGDNCVLNDIEEIIAKKGVAV